jgi:hypothetical protein
MERRYRALRVALVVFGVSAVGLCFLSFFVPLWMWEPHNVEDEQMLWIIYLVLGVFLILAARDPLKHLSLIWFTVWSSVAHGGLMAAQAISSPEHYRHLLRDVPLLFLVAIVLGALTPRASMASTKR